MTNRIPRVHGAVRLSRLAVACAAVCSTAAFAQTTSQSSLPETVVTATRFAEPAALLPLGVSVLTAQDIRDSGATTVNEAVMRLLGIVGRQDSYGGGNYQLDLRGFGSTADSNQVVILDGVRLNEGDLSSPRLSGIAIDTVERIEVLRGSGAVLYGEGATGGVIVITTKASAGKERRNRASVHAAAGSNSTRELSANATVAAGGFSLDVSGQKRDSDNHRDNFRSETDAGTATVQWEGSNVRIGARYAQDSLDSRLPGSLSAAQYAANPQQTNTPNDWGRIRNERTGVFAEAQFGSWQIAADAGKRDKTLRSMSAFGPYDYNVDASSFSLRARNESKFGNLQNIVVFGTDYNSWDRTVFGAFGSTAEQHSRAWYVKDDITLPTGTRVSLGYRTERFDKETTDTTDVINDSLHAWELGVSQPLSQNFTLWGRIGKSYRLANADEMPFNAVALVPQTSKDAEFGARWAQAGYKLEARLYRSSLENEIGYDPAGMGMFGPFGANVNFDPTRRQGLELDGSWVATKTVNLRANLAWRNATFRSGAYSGADVPLVPRRTATLRADWTPIANHRLSGGVNWVSSQHPDLANQCSMPSYTTADVRYAYQWQNVEFSLGIGNLFDRDYYSQAFSCVAGVTNGIYPEAGRTVTAAVRVSF